MLELLVVGTGGLAKETAQLARQIDPAGARWGEISYVAEKREHVGAKMPFGSVRYVDEDLQQRQKRADVVIAVGSPSTRRVIAQRLLRIAALSHPNLIHPTVEINDRYVVLGVGNVITQGVILTCDIRIGNFNLLNLNTTVGHDCLIGSFNVINPGCCISGGAELADACLLGTGCLVLESLQITSNTTIGAGAVVTRTITKPGVYIGAPARWLKE